MRLLETITIWANPNPLLVSRQAVFPGIAQLPDGDLLAVFSIGQAFDSADQRAVVSRSSDQGRTWSEPSRLHDRDFVPEESETFKPLALANGSVLATGYVFVRPDPLAPIVDPKTLKILPLLNKSSLSYDGGRTWSVPANFSVDGAPLELSGPCIQLKSGRILGAAPPFHLGAEGHVGWIVCSDDNGASWRKLSEFYRSDKGEVSPWECRLCETADGDVVVLFWAYDNANSKNLNNHMVVSRDGGLSFEAPIDTGIRGQAPNLMPLGDGGLLSIHAHREAPVGLVVRNLRLVDGAVVVEQELDLFADDRMGSRSDGISNQFGSLKFGQPSLTRLANGEILAACWQVENCQHLIKGYILAD